MTSLSSMGTRKDHFPAETMALITFDRSHSLSPLSQKRARIRPRSPRGGVTYHSYPVCLTFRFLFLATLFTCWLALYAANSRQLQIKYGSGIKQRASDVSKGSNQSLRGQGTSFGDQQKYKSDSNIGSSVQHGEASGIVSVPKEQATNIDRSETKPSGNNPGHHQGEVEGNEPDDAEIDLDQMMFVENRVLIAPGELPGYTGWARPEATMAGQFEVAAVSEMFGKAGEEWFVDFECVGEVCKESSGSLFYVRAYGPSIITGKVVDEGNGAYRASFYPIDPGRYTVEVVLEFGDKPDFEIFPVGKNQTELPYEGFLLPGFPMQITVKSADPDSLAAMAIANPKQRKWCSADKLFETSVDSGMTKGRWMVIDNIRTKYHRIITPNNGTGVSLLSYQHGLNSLGVKLRYENNDCKLLNYAGVNRGIDGVHLVDKCFNSQGIGNSLLPQDQIHIIFVGCSVMRLMHSSFNFLLTKSSMTNIRTTLVDMRRGMFRTLSSTKEELLNISAAFPNERRFVVFNSGLHDIDRLCSARMDPARQRDQNITGISLEGIPCIETYRRQFTDMVDFMADYPSEMTVFRSTTAGWLKYGNYGFSWPTALHQPFQRSHHMVSRINDIAFDVLAKSVKAKDIPIMDGFWTSLARPDNTEMGPNNQIGKHMVHPGVEVMDSLARRWLHIIVRSMCSSVLDF